MRDSASILPLNIENLCFEIDGRPLLRDLALTLSRGGVTMLIGPNGAGKSLALRLCHGLLAPTAGQVRWNTGNGTVAGRKCHAMVFQRPVMLRRSVRANLQHSLAATGIHPSNDLIEATLARFGLGALAEQSARLLSGGEQQRLAIARAWSLKPEVLFLDEPTSQLDPGATRQIEDIISGLAGEGMTILMTTHDLGQARRLSQRILFLNKGQLLEDAPTAAFFSTPKTEEARAFIAGDILW